MSTKPSSDIDCLNAESRPSSLETVETVREMGASLSHRAKATVLIKHVVLINRAKAAVLIKHVVLINRAKAAVLISRAVLIKCAKAVVLIR